MRELKFRVWDDEDKEMVYSDMKALCEGCKANDFRIYVNDSFYSCGVMQFTGIKDSKGKEIYEGDQILHLGKMRMYIVTYKVECASFKLVADPLTALGWPELWLKQARCDEYEIIGSIYDVGVVS